MSLDLQHQLESLYGLERRKDKPDLDGTRALLAALGHPQRRFRAVHVAGTNGKGSTCALIERVLREAGVRTGLFTSPHLVDFRERIRVNGQWADRGRLGERLEFIRGLPEGRDRTFFEVCTALAFDDFAARGVEWAVVEVGLGGRLDCTNVLAPEVCAITSIGLDHTEILGDTIDLIAGEKAGIVKPGVPVVVAPGLEPKAREVIERVATERGSPVLEAARFERERSDDAERSDRAQSHAAAPGLDLPGTRWGDLRLDLAERPGGFQLPNAATALAVLDALAERGLAVPRAALERGFRLARWPGRFEAAPHTPRLWWDGAHNAPGLMALERAWRRSALPAPARVVLAVSRDKHADAMLETLRRFAGEAVVFATRTRSERALEPATLAQRAEACGFRAQVAPSVAEACRAALESGTPRDLVLVTGSLFAVGEAMEAFGGAPGEWQ